ncbi:MAG: YraN family protein, partial [Desulfobulbaceae bacterium]|nr:YraN family protein [Desulfobulbaceae bacterium]
MILFSKWQKKIKPAAERKTGPYGEEIAASFLQAQGYAIIERNYRKRFGEIDIIAEDGEELVF